MPTEKAVCIVTPDIIGPIRNGGIGTHCYYLARYLAGRSDLRVSVLFTAQQADAEIAPWKDHYARLGIEFTWIGELPPPQAPAQHCGDHNALSARIHAHLRDRGYDFIHFQEWQANAFVPIQAKRAGLAYRDTLLSVTMHSSTQWLHQGMETWPSEPEEEALLSWSERFCCEHADLLVSPTQHMLDWAQENGWTLAESRRLLRYCYKPQGRQRAAIAAPDPAHLVFFGRLETRKGLGVFCRALATALERRPGCVREVSFLGKVASVDGLPAEEFIRRTLPREGGPSWRVESELDSFQAIDHIRRSGGVAVIPSLLDNSPFTVLECVEAGIPFLAASTGGIPELVDPAVLFEPSPTLLAERILDLDALLQRPLQHPYSNERAEQGWAEVHELAPPPAPALSRGSDRPLVSVCVAHHDHGRYLPQTLAALAAQDYPRLAVVVIDDGSADAESRRVFELQRDLYPQWTFVARENRGVERTRNEAAELGSGELILFQDSDNVPLPHMVSTLVDALERTRADCVTCWFRAFEGEGEPDDRTPAAYFGQPVGPCLEYACLENVLGDTNFLVRRPVFEQLGGFAVGEPATADWEFLVRLSLRGHAQVVVPEPLFWYRVLAGSMSSRRSRYHARLRVLRPYQERDPLLGRVVTDLTVPLWERLCFLEWRVRKLERRQAFLKAIPFLDPLAALVDRALGLAKRLRPGRERSGTPQAAPRKLRRWP